MTHEDYERAANHWKIKDASDEKMDRDTLLKLLKITVAKEKNLQLQKIRRTM